MPKARILTKAEDPRERFKRVAGLRVAKILDGIRSLGALNRAEYGPPAPDLVEHMIGTIERAVDELKESFRRKPGVASSGFRWPDE